MRARWIVVVTALVASSLFALSVWIGQWWTIGEVSIGPHGSRHCFGPGMEGGFTPSPGIDCRPAGLAWIGGSELWMRSAVATWVAGLVAMFLLALLAAGAAAGRVPRLVARTTLVALVTAAATGGYFVAQFPGLGGASLGQGAILYVLALAIGCIPAITVLRTR